MSRRFWLVATAELAKIIRPLPIRINRPRAIAADGRRKMILIWGPIAQIFGPLAVDLRFCSLF
jgi:hypothetical protein